MLIRRVELHNFKSFQDIDIKFDKYNVIIGANASGKSNLIDFFRFLRNVSRHGLCNAISMQGGFEYLCNRNLIEDRMFSARITLSDLHQFRSRHARVVRREGAAYKLQPFELRYQFKLKFSQDSDEFNIVSELLKVRFGLIALGNSSDDVARKYHPSISISRQDGSIKRQTYWPKKFTVAYKPRVFTGWYLPPYDQTIQSLFIEFPYIIPLFPDIREIFSGFAMYDIDPKLPKKANPITGKWELEEDGSNLAIVLSRIIENPEKKRQLINILHDALPFVDDLNVESLVDRSLLLKIKEAYTKDWYVPASTLSDGTISITAIILALFFQYRSFIVLEEPERSIHPYLISKLLGMIEEASNQTQVIVTTHNPEMVKHAKINRVLFMGRDANGFSCLHRPHDTEHVKAFLRDEIGLDELYVQNIIQ